MNTLLLSALLALPSFAANQGMEPAIIRTFAAAGAQSVGALNSPIMTGLGNLTIQTAAEGIPQGAFIQLSHTLAAEGLTVEQFEALPLEERLARLKHAADVTEANFERVAASLIDAVDNQKIDVKTARQFEEALGELMADGLFLKPETYAKVEKSRTRAHDLAMAPQRATDKWLAETPRKIFEGAFDADHTFVEKDGGWRLADQSPINAEATYNSLGQAFHERLDEIASMPEGPWKSDMLLTLRVAAGGQHLGPKLEAEGVDTFALTETILKAYHASRESPLKLQKATASFARWTQAEGATTPPSPKDVKTMYRFYEEASDKALSSRNRRNFWRVASFLKDPRQSGLPAFETLEPARRASRAREHRLSIQALIAYIASMTVMAGSAVFQGLAFGQGLFFVGLGLVVLTMPYMFWRMARRDSLDEMRIRKESAEFAVKKLDEALEGKEA